jgi:hypothetical protein
MTVSIHHWYSQLSVWHASSFALTCCVLRKGTFMTVLLIICAHFHIFSIARSQLFKSMSGSGHWASVQFLNVFSHIAHKVHVFRITICFQSLTSYVESVLILQKLGSPELIEHNQFIDSKKYMIYKDSAYIIEPKNVDE